MTARLWPAVVHALRHPLVTVLCALSVVVLVVLGAAVRTVRPRGPVDRALTQQFATLTDRESP